MADLADGDSVEVQGSAARPYTIKNTGGVYACSCPAWRHQSVAIEKRTCKHIRGLRGDAAEVERIGTATPLPATPSGAKPDAPPVMLANKWETDIDPTGWWLSEKLDGVRAYWDGKRFMSRLGNEYHAPDWFVAGLPDYALDGELWGGRKRFQKTISVVRRQDRSEHWKQVTFLVFDAPDVDALFEERLAHCRSYCDEHAPAHMKVVDHERCRDREHLDAELARVEKLGGEGLMMRQAESAYQAGRSSLLLKVKSFHDAEARVLAHLPGAGRHKGRLGALAVELPDGTGFSVGTGFSDAERGAPPAIGSVITFRYQELSDGGVPRFPSYVGVRDDFAWPGAPLAKTSAGSAVTPVAKSVPVAATASADAGTDAGAARRFEFSDDKSDKFWEIAVADASYTLRYGRIGSKGQSKTKTFADAAAATADAAKQIAGKVKKGYVER